MVVCDASGVVWIRVSIGSRGMSTGCPLLIVIVSRVVVMSHIVVMSCQSVSQSREVKAAVLSRLGSVRNEACLFRSGTIGGCII
jgi:hypothetical protein